VLSACQQLSVTTEVPVDNLTLETLSAQNKQVNRAIALIENGHSQRASLLVDEVLSFNSNHQTALSLKSQLELNPKDFFKTKRFSSYKVKAGDTLGGIAQKWLGNSVYFVSLAKLNNIRKPALLKPNTEIKIPLTENSQTIKKEKLRSKSNLKLLERQLLNKRYRQGLKKVNSLFIVEQDLERLYQLQTKLLNRFADTAISISGREKMLMKLSQLMPSSRNETQRKIYADFINNQQQQLLLVESDLLFKDQSYLDAAKKYIEANKVKLNTRTNNSTIELETNLVNKLHEQAIVFYRNHNLNNALSHWQTVLKVQPANKLAQKYIERTQKLLRKLNQY